MNSSHSKKILVRLPNWLGDLVMSTGFLNAISIAEPEATIDVIIKDSLSEMMALLNGINKSFNFCRKSYPGLAGAIRYGSTLGRAERYDAFFSLPDSFSSALTGFFTRSKKRIGYAAEMRSLLLTNAYRKPRGCHRAQEYLSLLNMYYPQKDLPCKVLLKKPDLNVDPMIATRQNDAQLKVIFNINSAATSRQIPPMKAVAIGKKLLNKLDCVLIFTGSENDTAITSTVIRNINNPDRCVDITGKTTLGSLAAICAASDIAISTDSGVAHVANALGTPVVVLFGAGNEQNTAPYNSSTLKIVRALGIPCAPCVSNTCKFSHLNCMNNIDENEIISATLKLLSHVS